MASYPPPPPYSPPGPPDGRDWKYQRRILKDQARAQRNQARYQMLGMRRRSILGPILAVAVGIVFLLVQTGHLRAEHLWEIYGHWWPLVLILAGVVLLAEWAIDRARPQDPRMPYARRSAGGGIITILILLAIAGAAYSGIHDGRDYLGRKFSIDPDTFEQFVGDKHESDETLAEQFPAGGMLTIDNPRGDVKVTGTSSDGEVHVSIHKQVYSRSDSDAESKARQLSPGIGSNGKLLSITVPNLSGATADLTVTVPTSAKLTVNANHGDVNVDKISAPLMVTANHGEVELSSIAGPVTIHINNNSSSFSAHSIVGPVSLEGHAEDLTLSDINGTVVLNGDFYGTTHLEHITSGVKFHTSRTDFQLARLDGEMEVSSDGITADQAVGPVVLTTANRNVNLDRMAGDLAVTNRNGSVEVTSAPPLGNVTVQNRNGSVTVTLPEHANFAVNAETTDGSIENDFSLPSVDHEQKATMNGSVGKGGPLIRINTSQGDVGIKKASIAPLPARAPAAPVAPVAPSRPQQSSSFTGGNDGSSVYVGKDGLRIISGSDGSSVIIGKDGLKITANADGSSVYRSRDGMQLIEEADGSKVYIGRDGTRFTQSSDGGKVYQGRDGSRISISADGTRTAKGPGDRPLSDQEMRERLNQAEQEVRRAEQRRDAERREQQQQAHP